VRIAFITTIADTQWHFQRGQNRFLADRGFEIHAIASPGPLLDRLRQRDGVITHAVPMSRSIRPLQDLRAVIRLWRVLRDIRPHLVHVSTPKAALVGSIAAWLAGAPARVLLVRGLALEGSTGRHRWLLRAADWICARLCHRTLCVSPSLRDVACDEGIVTRQQTVVPASGMSNGVDAGRFDPRAVSAAELPGVTDDARSARPPVIGFVGRLARDKGLDVIADAFVLIRREFPDARLLLVGGWDAASPPSPEVRMRLEHDPHVHITGNVADPAPYLKAMSVFVFASRREGFPNSPMEASAMELPVVATAATGTIDAVLDGITGVLVRPDHSAGMAAAVCRYLSSPDLRRRHGRAGRQRVIREFQPERIWQAILTEFVDLLRDRGLPLPAGETTARAPQRSAA
jgi:glycosyltransferase involved in cell wall biosynthesis